MALVVFVSSCSSAQAPAGPAVAEAAKATGDEAASNKRIAVTGTLAGEPLRVPSQGATVMLLVESPDVDRVEVGVSATSDAGFPMIDPKDFAIRTRDGRSFAVEEAVPASTSVSFTINGSDIGPGGFELVWIIGDEVVATWTDL